MKYTDSKSMWIFVLFIISIFIYRNATGIFPIMAVKPRTKPIFAMFDPITLFIAMDDEPFIAAFRLTKSSGSEVANATTVIPITTLEILNFKEIAIDALTIKLPPSTKSKKPKNIQTKVMIQI